MVKKYLPLFQLLAETSDSQRLAILQTATPDQLHAVAEAIYNVLHGVCPLNGKDKKELFNYRTVIRRMVSKEIELKQRRRLMKKYQAILPLILKSVIRLLRSD